MCTLYIADVSLSRVRSKPSTYRTIKIRGSRVLPRPTSRIRAPWPVAVHLHACATRLSHSHERTLRASQTHLQIAKGKAHTISHDERRAASKAQPHQSTRTYTHARSDKITHAWTVSNGLCQCVGPTLRRGHTRPRRSSAPPWPRRSHPARPALRQPHHPRHSVRMSWKEARVQPTGRGRGAWSQGEPPRTVTARAAMPSVGPALGQRTHPTPAVHAAAGEGVGEAACKLLAGGDGPEGRQRAKAADTAM